MRVPGETHAGRMPAGRLLVLMKDSIRHTHIVTPEFRQLKIRRGLCE
jgi:hypothetical protein